MYTVLALVLLAVAGDVAEPAASGSAEPVPVSAPADRAKPADPEGAAGKEATDAGAPVYFVDVVVTATREDRPVFDVPVAAHAIDGDAAVGRRLVHSVADALAEVPGIRVQKTSPGQTSPILRGFTGFRTLLLVEGIRLNNSTFRDGPNQYLGTVDVLSAERIEAVLGPASALHGSDAVGGAINVLTRGPAGVGEPAHGDGRVFVRGASAESSVVGRVEASGAGPRWGVLGGLSASGFGELHGGEETGRQPETGYDERDGDFKLELRPAEHVRLVLAHQAVRQAGVPRTHATIHARPFRGTSIGTDAKRDLDQSRDLTWFRGEAEGLPGWLDAVQGTLSFHVQEEDQLRVRRDGRSDRQGVDVRTLGTTLQLKHAGRSGRWTWGLERYADTVDSYRRDYDASGALRSVGVQGPVADDASYEMLDAYVQDEIPAGRRTEIVVGLRHSRSRARAGRVQDPATGAATSLSDDWSATVGSARALVRLDEKDHWHAFFGVGQAFRAPNLSDLTRLDTARSNEIETPSPGLAPERFLSWEAGVKASTDRGSLQVAAYRTQLDDLITRTPTGVVIDGNEEVTKRNSGAGWVAGLEVDGRYRAWRTVEVFGAASWTDGEVATFPTSAPVLVREPLDRLPPVTALAGVRWEGSGGRRWAEGLVTTAGRQDELSTRDAADTQRIPPGGTPGYAVVTARGGWRWRNSLSLSVAAENLLDEDHRVHGSGINEPGRNLVALVNWEF